MTDEREDAAWFRAAQFSRREFTATATAMTGYAALTQPVSAAAITTPSDGLVAGRVNFATTDREIPGYRARPQTGSDWPIVLVISEVFGIHTYIQDVVRRFAQQGYYAIAPDYFVRVGDATTVTDINVLLTTIISPTPDDQVLGDSRAALAFAAGEGADATRAGVTGFCWGGRQTWLHIAALPTLRAGVAWYGRLVGTPTPQQPSSPVDKAAAMTRPVLGLYGEKDDGIPLASVDAMRAALKAANRPGQIIVYRDAPHGFHADYRPTYRPMVAQAAWRACLAHFKANL
jgi:carboxymethylenebutenolidase